MEYLERSTTTDRPHGEEGQETLTEADANLALIRTTIDVLRARARDPLDWRRNFGVVDIFHEALRPPLPYEKASEAVVAYILDHAKLPPEVRAWCHRALGA